jgi:cysteinyl-tRNA synthetase
VTKLAIRSARGALVAMAALFLVSCSSRWHGEDRDFRQDMRDLVSAIGDYARARRPGFLVIPQNGHELLTQDGEPGGAPCAAYLSAIDGVGREDLFFGYGGDGLPTPAVERARMVAFMDLALQHGVRPLVTDYCSSTEAVDQSFALAGARGYLSFAAPSRELDVVPLYPTAPIDANASQVTTLAEARNFLYLLNPDSARFPTRPDYLAAIAATDYDVVILDLFYADADGNPISLTSADLAAIRTKGRGGSRLLVCYLSIGEAESYRYYWQAAWARASGRPSWLAEENPDWPGNYKVEYWDPEWQAILLGFDGVYLDIIDAHGYFEAAVGR